MEHNFKKYKKEFDFSYTFGAFPTIELLKSDYEILFIFIHSKYEKKEELESLCKKRNVKIIYNDKIINKLQNKESDLVIGMFKKKFLKLENENHILLFEPRDKGNLGTIFRTALGLGFKNIALIDSCDVFDPKTIRASMGSIFKLNIEIFKNFDEYKKTFKNNIYSFVLNKDSISLKNVKVKEPFTLIFGNESHGLKNINLDNTICVFIEQSKDIDSLNLPIATSIAMYKFKENLIDKK